MAVTHFPDSPGGGRTERGGGASRGKGFTRALTVSRKQKGRGHIGVGKVRSQDHRGGSYQMPWGRKGSAKVVTALFVVTRRCPAGFTPVA